MRVDRPVAPAAAPRPGAARRAAPGFDTALEGAADPGAGETEAAPAGAGAQMPETAALAAEIYATAVQAQVVDQQARRHGRAMLQAMAALQTAMLGGREGEARARLADLAGHAPAADDPILRLILREIGLRAAVELARGAI